MERAKGFLNKILELIKKPELMILPGQLAFFIVMSLFPLVALLGSILSLFSIPGETIKTFLNGGLPQPIIDIIISIINVQGAKPNFNTIIFFIVTFILASKGTYSMITVSNEIYKYSNDGIVKREMRAILMTFMLIILLLFLLLIPIFGETIFAVLKLNYGEKNNLLNIFHQIFQIVKYPITIVFLYLNIKTIYIISPDEEIEQKNVIKGSMFTTIGWILASKIFSLYVSTVGQYNAFYGSISNVVILLLWVYIQSYIFVFGMILNAGLYNLKKDDIKEENNLIEN